MYYKEFKKLPPYFRPYVARSDPALNSGIIATVLAIKIALSKFYELEEELEIPMFPIIGAAALPFRGGISPKTVDQFIHEYEGIRTTTIQSAFRYDFDKQEVIHAIKTLEEKLPKGKPSHISKKEENELMQIISRSELLYRNTIENIAPLVNAMAAHLPKRRERVQHTGLFGYSRGVGKVTLPRAISFTGALYSLGIPPEIIGTGRALAGIKKYGKEELLQRYYKNLRTDLLSAGRFVQKENIEYLARTNPAWREVQEDVLAIESFLGQAIGEDAATRDHAVLTQTILRRLQTGQAIDALVVEAAQIRKSIG